MNQENSLPKFLLLIIMQSSATANTVPKHVSPFDSILCIAPTNLLIFSGQITDVSDICISEML